MLHWLNEILYISHHITKYHKKSSESIISRHEANTNTTSLPENKNLKFLVFRKINRYKILEIET